MSEPWSRTVGSAAALAPALAHVSVAAGAEYFACSSALGGSADATFSVED